SWHARDPAARSGRRISPQTPPASAAGLAAPGRAASWSRSSGRRRRRRHTETLKMGSSARGAERGESVTLPNKTPSARLSPISQDAFPLRPLANGRVSKGGGGRGLRQGLSGRGTRQRGERGGGVRVSSGHAQGVRSWSWGSCDCVAETGDATARLFA